ncbi:hypothetical protein LTR91_002837 [Friedmanniomyces endolithicus]|uniref:Epoxide hydrolase N-terminal domain-containing protein n=1 Tax=Friedmanniomyces endolithicus TaxID=329885 RepID=A0AAN6KXW9_9PEZI|nr:hypothetical protein LTR94_011376 [Friedmanniomyces endolithicus]KAK0785839.1 hypothetical protein LTR59_010912 [Friedmanniomyces endolithicus]KAK0839769.1 hypothetical protein LTR03_011047 [Friedmanniomyces endolithicus]KAK0874922.1 hypothetical protein LTR87_011248 [Friedmanniomyces endolithicus]KAK0901505.1 hypothetical protein LTR02_008587 [Friedmanniomyces endolithicus]
MAQPKPFAVDISPAKIDEIKRRVAAFPWPTFRVPNEGAGEDDWAYGPPPAYMQAISQHWLHKYDWTARQARMNHLPQFMVTVDSFDIHYAHLRGSGSGALPVLLLHGWPYSFHSFHEVALRLAFPERFGGQAEDGVDVIIPSMPGYDFSPAAKDVTGPRAVAELYNKLVTIALGYPSVRHYGAEVRSGKVPAHATEEEREFAEDEYRRWQPESAYSKLQITKPVKLGYAMADSPVGVAAWIIEAFHAWSDLSGGRRFEDVFSFETLVDEVMLYLVTDAFHSSTWIYIGEGREGSNVLPDGKRIEVPTSILALPDPVFPMMPRGMAEKSRRVVRYTKAWRGAHFPFYEAQDELVVDLQTFMGELERGEHQR